MKDDVDTRFIQASWCEIYEFMKLKILIFGLSLRFEIKNLCGK